MNTLHYPCKLFMIYFLDFTVQKPIKSYEIPYRIFGRIPEAINLENMEKYSMENPEKKQEKSRNESFQESQKGLKKISGRILKGIPEKNFRINSWRKFRSRI